MKTPKRPISHVTDRTRSKLGRPTVCLFFLVCWLCRQPVLNSESQNKYYEEELKTAALYNFLKYIEWPESNDDKEKKQPILIGIWGKDLFRTAEKKLSGHTVKDRKIKVLPLEQDEFKYEPKIKKYTAVFINKPVDRSGSLKPDKYLKHLRDSAVLTIGHEPGFLEAGGIINFLIADNKLRFEINQEAAEKSSLKIPSKLLRLAKRVIQKDKEKD